MRKLLNKLPKRLSYAFILFCAQAKLRDPKKWMRNDFKEQRYELTINEWDELVPDYTKPIGYAFCALGAAANCQGRYCSPSESLDKHMQNLSLKFTRVFVDEFNDQIAKTNYEVANLLLRMSWHTLIHGVN